MRISLNTSNRRENICAAFIFFTRLPLWRWCTPGRAAYATVVEHWPLTGWLTAAVMAAVIYFGSMVFPYPVAIILAILSRVLLTGALHEDGLADFFDGFGGGGTDRQRILAIMKDSHVGTYGVLALCLYMLLLYFTLSSLPAKFAALVVLAADPYSKMLAAQAVMMLPYARTEETSKARVVYRRMSVGAGVSLFFQGILPVALLLYMCNGCLGWDLTIFIPGLVMYFLYLFIWRRLRGYTGDCCGAMFLMIELSFYLCVACQYFNTPALWKLF